jgi:hypothetical protein
MGRGKQAWQDKLMAGNLPTITEKEFPTKFIGFPLMYRISTQ